MKTFLQVQTILADPPIWASSHKITQDQELTFRWWHTAEYVPQARWELYQADSAGYDHLKDKGWLTIPAKGKFGVFKVSVCQGAGKCSVKVATMGAGNSLPVVITLVKPGSSTIELPKIVIKINNIYMIDDSDQLSGGEIRFCFWLKYSGGVKGGIATYFKEMDTYDAINPQIQFSTDYVQDYVTLYASGQDDDTCDGLACNWLSNPVVPVFSKPGPGSGFVAGFCNAKTPASFDYAEGHIDLPIAPGPVTQTQVKNFTSFIAEGTEDLRFRVDGTWQIVP